MAGEGFKFGKVKKTIKMKEKKKQLFGKKDADYTKENYYRI